MKLPTYNRSVAPEPVSSGGFGGGGVASPIAPARQPDIFGDLSNLTANIIKREGEKKDRTDSLTGIDELNRLSLQLRGDMLKVKGINAEGTTAGGLDTFDKAFAEIEKRGYSQRAMDSIRESAMRMRMSLGGVLQTHERTETDAALVAKQKAVASGMVDQLSAFRGDGTGTYDPDLFKEAENDVRAAITAAGVQQGHDKETIDYAVKQALSGGIRNSIGGMLIDGDISAAKEMLEKQGDHMTNEDREKVSEAIDANVENAWMIDTADNAFALHPGKGNRSARIAYIREQGKKSGHDAKVIDAALSREKSLTTIENNARTDMLVALEDRIDAGEASPEDWAAFREEYGVEAQLKKQDEVYAAIYEGPADASQQAAQVDWEINSSNTQWYLDMNEDEALEFARSLPRGSRSAFRGAWSKARQDYLTAQQKAEVEAAKPLETKAMYGGSTIGNAVVDLLMNGRDPKKHSAEVYQIMSTMNRGVIHLTSQGIDENEAKQMVADDMARDVVMEEGFMFGGKVKRTFELAPKDLDIGNIVVDEDQRTEYERTLVTDAVRNLVETGRSISWTPEDVDEEDDRELAYSIALWRIVTSLSAAQRTRDEAARRLTALLGPDAIERLNATR